MGEVMEQSIGSAIWTRLKPATIQRVRGMARAHLARLWRVEPDAVPDVEVDKFVESRIPATIEKMVERSYGKW
jgi:hypothetical protein